jgi:hypothetical protein
MMMNLSREMLVTAWWRAALVCVVIELSLPPALCIRQKRKGWGTRRCYAFGNSGLVKVDSIFDPHRPCQKQTSATLDHAWRRLLEDMFSSN